MARPLKDGIDYFPFDVGFLQDKKIRLIKGEYGIKGVVIVIQLLCSIKRMDTFLPVILTTSYLWLMPWGAVATLRP